MAIYTKEEQFKLISGKLFAWMNLREIDNQYEEVCLEAVRKYGRALEYVKEQTSNICLEAVKNNGYALQYVKEQTEEICLEAVKRNGGALEYVKEQTEDVCLEAVKESGYAIEYVKEQTYDICLEAVKRNGIVLSYVKEQNYEICLEAIKENGLALKYVKNKTPELYFYAYLNTPMIDWDLVAKEQISKFINEEYIKNKVFCDNREGKINKNVFYFNKKTFVQLKDYLLSGENANKFMLYDTSEDEIIKEIALSNNKLIIINTGNVNDTHKILANEIIDLEVLKKGVKGMDIPF